jgi:hypothetical protein
VVKKRPRSLRAGSTRGVGLVLCFFEATSDGQRPDQSRVGVGPQAPLRVQRPVPAKFDDGEGGAAFLERPLCAFKEL